MNRDKPAGWVRIPCFKLGLAGVAGLAAAFTIGCSRGAASYQSDQPSQAASWQEVRLPGATCGRGAPYKYFLSRAASEGAGLLIYLMGGGACVKEGPAAPGSSAIGASLHCMDYPLFVEPTLLYVRYFSSPFFERSAANPFSGYHLVFVPYCTADLYAGRMQVAYDYDPDPQRRFDVTHRGHLNLVAVLDDLQRQFPAGRAVVLTGSSAGGFGAIYNFPEVIERWPDTVLIPDAGIAPDVPGLMQSVAGSVVERWQAAALLPEYCPTSDCMTDTLRLMRAHAGHYDGSPGRWRPFGLLQGQRDSVLSEYLEIDPCTYQLGLQRGLSELAEPNLRAWVPATEQHTFLGRASFATQLGQDYREWFAALARSEGIEDLPASSVDPWLPCNAVFMPFVGSLPLGRMPLGRMPSSWSCPASRGGLPSGSWAESCIHARQTVREDNFGSRCERGTRPTAGSC